MVQQNLFSHHLNKQKQPQRAASGPRTDLPSTSGSRQTGAQQNYTSQFRQEPQQHMRVANLHSAAHPETRPATQREDVIRLSGRVGRYFEVKQTPNGHTLATFSLAAQKPFRNESGNWAKRTVWQRVVAWGQTAETIGQQLSQGARVSVVGKFKTREWTDRQNNLRTTTELVARQVDFLDAAAA